MDKKVQKIIKEYATKNSDYWRRVAKKQRNKTVSLAQKESPAYRIKYKKYHIDKNFCFEDLPIVDKTNFLKKNTMDQLLCGGLSQPLILTSTSGSTGEPYYFPRKENLDLQYSILVEQFLKQGENKGKKPALVLICFGMGVWIGGIITYQAFMMASRRGKYPVSILTPGINMEEILKALRKLSPQFSETIIIGYPPFVKDIIDQALFNNIPIKQLRVRLMFAAEVFTEDFRDYLANKVTINNIYRDTLSVYGSADVAAMAWETGISVLIKRLLKSKSEIFKYFFGETQKMPTIAQYNPNFIYFESLNNEILLTAESAIPLVRYAIGDRGLTFTYKEIDNGLRLFGVDLIKEAKKVGILDINYQLPFVCIFERNDFSTTIYGLQIYPELIREALSQKTVNNVLTGKFVYQTKFDTNQDQYLEINIECAVNVDPSTIDVGLLAQTISSFLTIKSSEFAELIKYVKNRPLIQIILWPYGHDKYFKLGIKQKWVVK